MLANRVKETTSTTGTGNLTLAGAATNFRTFSLAKEQGERFTYWIIDGTNNVWETGIGYLSASTTLVRESVLDNSSGTTSALSLSAGTKDVFTSPSLTSGFMSPGGATSNDWLISSFQNATAYRSQKNLSTDTIFYFPFYLATECQIDALRVDVIISAGTKLRIGFYTNEKGRPGDLIVQSGDLDPSTTGTKIASITAQNLSGQWLWAAIVADGASGIAASDNNYTLGFIATLQTSSGGSEISAYVETATSWTVLPPSAGTLSAAGSTDIPRMTVQAL